jgi:hypothetical protein
MSDSSIDGGVHILAQASENETYLEDGDDIAVKLSTFGSRDIKVFLKTGIS